MPKHSLKDTTRTNHARRTRVETLLQPHWAAPELDCARKISGGGLKGHDAMRAMWMPKHSLKDTAWTTAQPEGCTNAAMISVEAQGWRSELPSVTMDKDDKTHKSLFRSEPSVANPDETRSRDTSHAIPRSCEDKRVLR